MASEREKWIQDKFPDDNCAGFKDNEELSFLYSSRCTDGQFYKMFSIKLIFENIPRLTNEYNTRCLPQIKTHFPSFYQGLVDSGSVFGKEAVIPCEMRGCDEDEYKTQDEAFSLLPAWRYARAKRYDDLRKQMRKNHLTFEPTPDLFRLLATEATYPPLNEPFYSCVNQACFMYGDGNFRLINSILRSQLPRDQCNNAEETEVIMSSFLPGLLFPFSTKNDLVLWRADMMNISTDTLVVKGMMSATLIRGFCKLYGDKRNIKINLPPGTPFLPVIITKDRHAEITLLPGTELTKVSEKAFEDGSFFVEYKVTSNPPPFTDLEVATILRAAFRRDVSTDVPTTEETLAFIYQLVNNRYHGDY